MNETILQFGAGKFLRAFTDLFVHELNAAGKNVGKIVVAQTTGDERARLLNAQNGQYHVWLRGLQNGEPTERLTRVESVSRALFTGTEWPEVLEVARSPHLRCIVSNTTEAGLALDDADATNPPADEQTPPRSFPAKLLACLRARFDAGQPGLLILPSELFDNNAVRLRELVLRQADIRGWASGTAFTEWLNGNCAWANTLVDRIVSGSPDAHPLLAEDALMTVAEPYQLWAMENRPGTELFDGHPAVVRTDDVRPYGLRKVRILNGAHTGMLTKVRREKRDDLTFVREAVADPQIGEWVRGLIFEEIVPTVADRVDDAEGFAHQVLERFANPFLDHRISDIAVHHDKKVPIRLGATRDEFVARFGRVPARLEEAIHTRI